MLVLIRSKREAIIDDGVTYLTRREWSLAEYLIKHKGYVKSRHDIMRDVFGLPEHAIKAGLKTRVVDQHIARIRQKIGKDWIMTFPSFGYKVTSGAIKS